MPDTRSQRNDARGNYARFVGLGFTLILIFGLPTVVGFFLDRLAGTLPLFLLTGRSKVIGVVLGVGSFVARYGFVAIALGIPMYRDLWPTLPALGGFAAV